MLRLWVRGQSDMAFPCPTTVAIRHAPCPLLIYNNLSLIVECTSDPLGGLQEAHYVGGCLGDK